MTVLVHISDLHFGTERAEVVERLVQLIEDQRPDLVVASGDITQRARRRQFRDARVFLDRLPFPRLVVPGNHDIPLFNLLARWLSPYAGYARQFGRDLEPGFESAGLHVVGVNSSTPTRHKNGELDATTVERACERIRRGDPDALRIIVMHHPLLAITGMDTSNLARGYPEAIAAFAKAGVDMVLGGHIHLPYVRPFRISGDDAVLPMWAVQAGTAVSTRIRSDHPNSIHIIRHVPAPGPSTFVEQWDHDENTCAFVMVCSVPLTLRHDSGDDVID